MKTSRQCRQGADKNLELYLKTVQYDINNLEKEEINIYIDNDALREFIKVVYVVKNKENVVRKKG